MKNISINTNITSTGSINNNSTVSTKKGETPMSNKSVKNKKFIPETSVELNKNLKIFSYAGSKKKFGDQFNEIHSYIDSSIYEGKKIVVEDYIEGFAGSLAALVHNTKNITASRYIINDLNSKLINIYIHIQNNPQVLWESYCMIEDKFEQLVGEDTIKVRIYPIEDRKDISKAEDFYKYIRIFVNENQDNLDLTHAACMLFILHHNFNGMYSENKKNEFNASFNWNTQQVKREVVQSSIFDLHRFFSNNIVVFETLDIDSLISKYNNHDTFIYLDGPYINTGIQYVKRRKKEDSFNLIENHFKMIDTCSKYKYVMYSNNHDDRFIEYFDHHINFSRKHSVSTKKSKKSKLEILGIQINSKDDSNTSVLHKTRFKEVPSNPSNNVEPTKISMDSNIFVSKPYTPKNIKLFESFAGMGAQHKALSNLNNVEFEVVGTSEWFIDAIIAYDLIHNGEQKGYENVSREDMLSFIKTFTLSKDSKKPYKKETLDKWKDEKLRKLYTALKRTKNVGSIVDIKGEDLPSDIDIFTYSFPCTNVSVSGLLNGLSKGSNTASSLVWEVIRVLTEMKQLNKLPNVLLMENVKNLVSKKFIEDWNMIKDELELLGYNTYDKVINAKDKGSIQARERVFGVSVLKQIDTGFKFNDTIIKNNKTIKDILDTNVDNSYEPNKKVENTHIIEDYIMRISGMKYMKLDGYSAIDHYNKVYAIDGKCPTLLTNNNHKIYDGNKIRHFTQKEGFKLMGFDKSDFTKIEGHMCKTNVYKLIGNSIVVEVLEDIFSDINTQILNKTPLISSNNIEELKHVA